MRTGWNEEERKENERKPARCHIGISEEANEQAGKWEEQRKKTTTNQQIDKQANR